MALAGRGSAARYEDIGFCVVKSLANGVILWERHCRVGVWLVLSLAGRGSAARYEGIGFCAS